MIVGQRVRILKNTFLFGEMGTISGLEGDKPPGFVQPVPQGRVAVCPDSSVGKKYEEQSWHWAINEIECFSVFCANCQAEKPGNIDEKDYLCQDCRGNSDLF